MSDRDSRFTAHFWKSFQKAMGTRLTMSIAFHPQTDGQYERTIQVLEDMLRACVLDHKGSWEEHLLSRPESRSDPIGGSEPVSGTRDSGMGLFFFFFF